MNASTLKTLAAELDTAASAFENAAKEFFDEKDDLESARDKIQERLDKMSEESLENGRGEPLQAKIGELETKIKEIEGLADYDTAGLREFADDVFSLCQTKTAREDEAKAYREAERAKSAVPAIA